MLSESMEEYLEALWIILKEENKEYAKINEIANMLAISPPSVVEMLKKMEKLGFITYETRIGVKLTEKGERLAREIIRNHRLSELLLTEILGMKIDLSLHENACFLEHHISDEIAKAVCIKLGHPTHCPHGKKIPRGKCCER